LNSSASGNLTAVANFGWSQLTNLAVTAAASKIPGVEHWAETIGDLAERGADLALRQPDRNNNAIRQAGREKSRGRALWNESSRLVFPSLVQDVCGLRGDLPPDSAHVIIRHPNR
jgi:hypothetical protein